MGVPEELRERLGQVQAEHNVSSAICLRVCYAMPGPGAIGLCACYAKPSDDLPKPGTDVACAGKKAEIEREKRAAEEAVTLERQRNKRWDDR